MPLANASTSALEHGSKYEAARKMSCSLNIGASFSLVTGGKVLMFLNTIPSGTFPLKKNSYLVKSKLSSNHSNVLNPFRSPLDHELAIIFVLRNLENGCLPRLWKIVSSTALFTICKYPFGSYPNILFISYDHLL